MGVSNFHYSSIYFTEFSLRSKPSPHQTCSAKCKHTHSNATRGSQITIHITQPLHNLQKLLLSARVVPNVRITICITQHCITRKNYSTGSSQRAKNYTHNPHIMQTKLANHTISLFTIFMQVCEKFKSRKPLHNLQNSYQHG